MSGLTARLSMYAFGRIELQMACTDSMEMVSLLSEYVCGMRFRPSASRRQFVTSLKTTYMAPNSLC
jgi:hypothetical protein